MIMDAQDYYHNFKNIEPNWHTDIRVKILMEKADKIKKDGKNQI